MGIGTAIGAVVGGSAGLLVGIGKALFFGRQSKVEKAYEASALADLERLTGGAGGMSASKRMTAKAEAQGEIDRAMREGEQKMLRGANVGSGQAFKAQQELLRQRAGGEAAAMSDIRRQDLEEAERLRQEAYQKAMLAETMRGKRHDRLQGAIRDTDFASEGRQAGAAGREFIGSFGNG